MSIRVEVGKCYEVRGHATSYGRVLYKDITGAYVIVVSNRISDIMLSIHIAVGNGEHPFDQNYNLVAEIPDPTSASVGSLATAYVVSRPSVTWSIPHMPYTPPEKAETPKCECGSEKAGLKYHSNWCPLSDK